MSLCFKWEEIKKKETSVFIVVNVLFVLQGSDVFDGEDLKTPTVVDPPLQRWSTCNRERHHTRGKGTPVPQDPSAYLLEILL